MKKYNSSILIILLCTYLCGYSLVRQADILIHQASWEVTDDGSKTIHTHKIRTGDFVGLFQPTPVLIASVSMVVFYPIVMIEQLLWHVVQPSGIEITL